MARSDGPSVPVHYLMSDFFPVIREAFPGLTGLLDLQAITIAFEDLGRQGRLPQVSPFQMDLIAELLAPDREDGALVLRLAKEISKTALLGRVLDASLTLFLGGSSLARSELDFRAARADALWRFIAVISKPIKRELRRAADRIEKREEYASKKVVPIARDSFLTSNQDSTPDQMAIARESVPQVLSKLEHQFSPEAVRALRAFFINPYAHASTVAQESGVSPATLSRIRSAFTRLAREEFDFPDAGSARAFLAAFREIAQMTA